MCQHVSKSVWVRQLWQPAASFSKEICTSIQHAHDLATFIDSMHPKVVSRQVSGRSEGAKLTIYHEFFFGAVDPHQNGQIKSVEIMMLLKLWVKISIIKLESCCLCDFDDDDVLVLAVCDR